jgi:FG-GAP-like repeat
MNKFIAVFLILGAGVFSCNAQSQQLIFAPAPGSPFAVGNQPSDIVAGDVNKDGKLDIVTANTGSRDLTVLLGDGRGGLNAAPGSPIALAIPPSFIVMGDLNKDSNLDLALAQHDGSYDVTILFGDGRGRFTTAPTSPFTPLKSTDPHTHGIVLGDVNRDGNLDIITANGGANAGKMDAGVSVSLGDGKGGFQPAPGSPVAIGKLPAGITVGDVNQDGMLDIVTPNEGSKDFAVLLGNGSGGFKSAAGSPFALQRIANDIGIGDVNQDGRADIVITHDDSSLVTVLLGYGRGADFKPAPGSPFDLGHHAWNLIIVDVNDDTRMDLIMRGPENRIMAHLGNGKGVFSPALGPAFAVGLDPFGFTLGDVNSDGRVDIITANHGSNNVTVLLNEGKKR